MARRKSFWQRVRLAIFGDGKRRCHACKRQISRGDHWRMVVYGWRRKPQHCDCKQPKSYRGHVTWQHGDKEMAQD